MDRGGRRLRIETLESRQLLAATIQPSPISAGESYAFDLVQKAQPDEWFTGTLDAEGNYVSGPYYPLGQQPAGTPGRPKVNQDYVWAMVEANGFIYYASSGNVLCVATVGLAGVGGAEMNDIHVSEGAQSQYPLPSKVPEELRAYLGDWRPPQMHLYDPATSTYKNITPKDSRVNSTLGLRSVGAANGVVLYAGPDIIFMGMNVFAYNSVTQEYLGSKHIANYNDIRNWVNAGSRLYTSVLSTYSTTGEGAVLQWTGNLRNPFRFREVATLDLDGANMCVHNNRLYVGTWPLSTASLMGAMGYHSTALPGIWMSPELSSNGSIKSGGWKKVWEVTEYEVDPVIAQSVGLGAMASFDGYLYFGTMQVPGTGGQALLQASPGYTGSTSRAERPLALFRCKDFDSSTPHVQLLYGDNLLYKFTPPPDMTLPGAWTRVENNAGKPLFGQAGMDNSGNYYTWSMEVYQNRLYVGTFDAATIVDGDYYLDAKGDVTQIEKQSTENWMGADLWCFFPDTSAGDPVRPFAVSKTGVGNPLNHGIRNMTATSTGLYLGTANASNLLCAEDNATRYPDAPGLQAGGWELRLLTLEQSTPPMTFTFTGATTVAEGISSNTVLGTFAVTGPAPGAVYTWSLLDNANGRFFLTGNQLSARMSRSDLESMPFNDIVVRVTDADGIYANQTFRISITDSAERPAYIQLSGLWVSEGSAAGTVVANVSAYDEDAGDTVTLTLTNDAGGRFKLDPAANQLKVKDGTLLDYETATTHSVTLRATDSTGLYRDSTFTIYVMDVNEALSPTLTSIDVQEGTTQRSFVRYVDLVFASPDGVAGVIDENRVTLNRYALDGTGGTSVSLSGIASATGSQIRFDFASKGLTTNGYYEIALDLDDNGSFETLRHFYRLLGDVTGDKTVSKADRDMVAAAMGQTGYNLEADVNGDGVVNWIDRLRVSRASGTLIANLPIDD